MLLKLFTKLKLIIHFKKIEWNRILQMYPFIFNFLFSFVIHLISTQYSIDINNTLERDGYSSVLLNISVNLECFIKKWWRQQILYRVRVDWCWCIDHYHLQRTFIKEGYSRKNWLKLLQPWSIKENCVSNHLKGWYFIKYIWSIRQLNTCLLWCVLRKRS